MPLCECLFFVVWEPPTAAGCANALACDYNLYKFQNYLVEIHSKLSL